MKNVLILAVVVFMGTSCKENSKKMSNENGSEHISEINVEPLDQEEWTILFDGTSFDGWKGYLMDDVPKTWKLEDGAMVFYPSKKNTDGEGHNIVTENGYTDFVLSLEWKISEGGNSGIFWGVNEVQDLKEAYESGPEIQVLDNLRHPDAKVEGKTHQAGGLYDMVAPSNDVTKPVGEWNIFVLTINHKTNEGSVVLNGEKIVDFPVTGDDWNAMVAKSKFADWKYFGKYTTGKIGLQDHGFVVAYRNIKIKEL